MLKAIKSSLPWWFKVGAKLILSRMPMTYGFWQGVGLFRHGYMDTASYALGVFDEHIKRAGLDKVGLDGKILLEIGPGDSIATAIIAYAYGAKAILVDFDSYAKNSIETYRTLCALLYSRGLRIPDLSRPLTIDEILIACDGSYITDGGIASWHKIATESVDFVFSQAVLEHVRKHEFLQTQKEAFRVMKQNGVASHRIDLRDHLGGALNNLRFSEYVWESDFFVKSGFYTNRIQLADMLCQFEIAGFKIESTEIQRWPILPTPREKMDKVFAALPDSALNVSGFDVLLRRERA
ncbi:MAG: class I SAM-dependent methyltransferase [Proteobacteria bacterium]|nr:class I SAM-dependent methyltransferase [Pseudomonadota bacterium]